MKIEITSRDVKKLTYSYTYLCISPSFTFILFYGENEHLVISSEDNIGTEEYLSTLSLDRLLKDAVVHEVVLFWPNLTAEINQALIKSKDI